MPPLLLHIPHASTHIPMYEGYVVDKERLAQEILKLTDWYTDDLFESVEDQTVAASFSRVFCDVERFSEDEREIMAQHIGNIEDLHRAHSIDNQYYVLYVNLLCFLCVKIIYVFNRVRPDSYFCSRIAASVAASRAIGTRNGEQLT